MGISDRHDKQTTVAHYFSIVILYTRGLYCGANPKSMNSLRKSKYQERKHKKWTWRVFSKANAAYLNSHYVQTTESYEVFLVSLERAQEATS